MRVVAYEPIWLLNPENVQVFESLLISADRALEMGDRDAAGGCIADLYRIFDSQVSSVAHRFGADAQVRNA